MFYLLSWRGRGYVAFLAIFLAVGCMGLGAVFSEDVAAIGFALGWIAAGALCFVLGRRWNRPANDHVFCKLPLQTWGPIYASFGLLLLPYSWQAWRMDAHAR